MVTSREKPQEFIVIEGETLPVRSLQLYWLQESECREIFKTKGSFYGSNEEWGVLIERYAGNPLALKIIATTIQELLNGDIAEFFKQNSTLFRGICQVLEQQFERLSDLEKEIMYWLAINREAVTLAELRDDVLSPVSKAKLLESLEGLGRRTLIEKCGKGFTLQPVVMEDVTDRLIEGVCKEIAEFKGINQTERNLNSGELKITGLEELKIEGLKFEGSLEVKAARLLAQRPGSSDTLQRANLQLFRNHDLIKPQGKEYVRDTQVRLILKPVSDRLFNRNESEKISKIGSIKSSQRYE